MVIPGEVEYPRSLKVKRNVEIIGELVQEMAGVSTFIPASAIVGAAHIGPRPDALISPPIPHAIRIKAHWNHRRLAGQMAFLWRIRREDIIRLPARFD
jgi:hypothetical protein